MLERFEDFTFTVYQIQRCWNKIASAGMEKYGLKGSYVVYLLALSRQPEGLTAAELGQICGRDKADVSRAVAVMESKDILACKGKKYRAKLVLTERGAEMTKKISRQAEYAEIAASAGLSVAEREAMNRALKTVRNNLEKLVESGLPAEEDNVGSLPDLIPIY